MTAPLEKRATLLEIAAAYTTCVSSDSAQSASRPPPTKTTRSFNFAPFVLIRAYINSCATFVLHRRLALAAIVVMFKS
jgi:hypothetical protein